MGILGGCPRRPVGGLIHAIATVHFGRPHRLRCRAQRHGRRGGAISPRASPTCPAAADPVAAAGSATEPPVPYIGDPLLTLERKHIFVVSDLAGIVRGLTTGVSVLTILAIALFALTYWVLWRTPSGLRLRSVGESPAAAESPVSTSIAGQVHRRARLWCVGGPRWRLLSPVAQPLLPGRQTGARFTGPAAMIFGNWRPGGLLAGSALSATPMRSGCAGRVSTPSSWPLRALTCWWGSIGSSSDRHTSKVASLSSWAALTAWWYASPPTPSQPSLPAPRPVTTCWSWPFASQRLRDAGRGWPDLSQGQRTLTHPTKFPLVPRSILRGGP